MRALIFGITGQDGFYLSALLKQNGVEVIGVSRNNVESLIGDVSNYQIAER